MSQQYPCSNARCVAVNDRPYRPCKIHRDHPNYRPSSMPITRTDHWKIEDPQSLHDRRRSDAPEQQDFYHPNDVR